jgi:hypothetical protein
MVVFSVSTTEKQHFYATQAPGDKIDAALTVIHRMATILIAQNLKISVDGFSSF